MQGEPLANDPWFGVEPEERSDFFREAEDAPEPGLAEAILPGGAGPEEWAETEPQPRRFIVPHLIVRGAAGLLGGQDGVGKSLIAQQMATCAAAGLPFLGLEVERVRALYVTCEDPLEELHRRQIAINTALRIEMHELQGWLRAHSLKGQLGNELATFDQNGRLRPTSRYEQLRAAALSSGAQLVLVDNAAHVFPGNENARHDVAAFLGLLERLSEEIDGAVVLLAHPNKQHGQGYKQGNEYSGSTGWSAHVRNRLFLDWAGEIDGPADRDERVLRRSKANYAARGEEIRCRWHNWAFVRDVDLPEDQRDAFAQTLRDRHDEDAFLNCLREWTRQHRAVSERRSPTFAPTVFAELRESSGVGKKRLEAAMNALWRCGRIERAELWKGPDRKPVFGLRETVRGTLRETLAGDAGNGVSDREEITRETAGNTHIPPKGGNGRGLEGPAPSGEQVG